MVKLGRRWKLKSAVDSTLTWKTVSYSEVGDVVGLSGPGAMRSMIYVTLADLKDEWEEIKVCRT